MNATRPDVVLAAWQGGFTIGLLRDCATPGLDLFHYREPKLVKGRRYHYALRTLERSNDGRVKIVSERLLTVKSKAAAQRIFRAEFHAKDVAAQKRTAQSGPSLKESQLRCLARAYPETVALLSEPEPVNSQSAFEAYQRETMALTGVLVDTLQPSAFRKMARVLINADRRKTPAFDAVGFELVAGWHLRGYNKMTPEDRVDALKKLGLGKLLARIHP